MICKRQRTRESKHRGEKKKGDGLLEEELVRRRKGSIGKSVG
jgi:hypothetical protein